MSREIRFDLNKALDSDLLRLNLLLSSLYLTAFEILKMSIIEGTKDFLVDQDELTSDAVQSLGRNFQKELVDRFVEYYKEQVNKYESEIGVNIKNRDRFGLIPSCEWLVKQGVLSEEDFGYIKAIRDHRNEIAHELPTLLVSKGLDVDIGHFQKMRQLIHKVDVFWARNDLLFEPNTLDEVDITDISDEEIISGRVALLDLITNTVIEYLNEIVRSKPSASIANESKNAN
jgi:hypothetical protein